MPADEPPVLRTYSCEECPICYESFTQEVITPCGHQFCADCLKRSMRMTPPVCAVCDSGPRSVPSVQRSRGLVVSDRCEHARSAAAMRDARRGGSGASRYSTLDTRDSTHDSSSVTRRRVLCMYILRAARSKAVKAAPKVPIKPVPGVTEHSERHATIIPCEYGPCCGVRLHLRRLGTPKRHRCRRRSRTRSDHASARARTARRRCT